VAVNETNGFMEIAFHPKTLKIINF